jgi:ADP-heptose:LPS heptosyltransferase
MLAPIVRAAAEQYPDLEITMLSQQRFADLFAHMPVNVLFHGVDTKSASLHEIVSGLDTYDLVADMHSVIRSVYVRTAMRLKGAKVASINKGRIEKIQLTRGIKHTPLKHTTERYTAVLAELGLPVDMDKTQSPKGTLSKSGIGIAPFAAHQGKIYPIERMERVVQLLSEKGEHVVLFGGGKKEKAILESWAKKYPNVESVAGRHSMSKELDIIGHLRVMVTMDSGNMHLASLVGTRVVSIWGATHPYAGFLGYGQNENDCIQRDLPCRPCSIYGNKPCKFGDYRCMDIQPEEILKQVLL